jgi:hypothetical protein
MPAPTAYAHLGHLTVPLGLYEHALGSEPRVEHGFCLDDVARALVVTARVPEPSDEVRSLRQTYLEFVLAAGHDDGMMHNRRNVDGTWADEASCDDHWGRALWALGTTVAHVQDPVLAARAREGALRALQARSMWPRATAYAVLGAGQLLADDPGVEPAVALLSDARRAVQGVDRAASWPWPQPRLSYANAVLPEAMLVIGDRLDDTVVRDDGLALLRWLVDLQTQDGHLSVVASGGRSATERGDAFAQQPIEVAALAEACTTAYAVTLDARWRDVVALCREWFDGANDLGAVMHDSGTGGGYDGLEATGASTNQGAESTLAWLATAQLADLSDVARRHRRTA